MLLRRPGWFRTSISKAIRLEPVNAALGATLTARLLEFLNEPGHVFIGEATGGNLGYRIVFATAVVWFVLGTVMVSRIRGVR